MKTKTRKATHALSDVLTKLGYAIKPIAVGGNLLAVSWRGINLGRLMARQQGSGKGTWYSYHVVDWDMLNVAVRCEPFKRLDAAAQYLRDHLRSVAA